MSYEEGWTPFPPTIEEEADKKSKVLDSSGKPYEYRRTYKIGFDLRKTNDRD